MKKHWWVRLGSVGYGRWVPTGCLDLDAAMDYIETYFKDEVREWLQL